ncbi:hypothetical protein OPV22_001327 [Ensete ventricosum]|uniref:Auxin response factor n=1 Tax=Ensete ventricosum TaxID=4639 RepID=A0AAV8RUK1_ENSVE|nr:hypothetical protein OPV22_001327 [Ensete ventricosum]
MTLSCRSWKLTLETGKVNSGACALVERGKKGATLIGHSEQVAVSTNKEIDSQIPNYPSLPPQLICQLHNVTMHADVETDEVYAQMTLQPLSPQEQKDPYFPNDLEKVFPPLDFSQQPPVQELVARDLHGNEWKFRHIFRGQPKRHLLTTGWSIFVSAKRLVAGDSVLFIWNENNQLLLAAHAAATNSRFTIFYNPRASPSEFVIPLAKYVKAVYHTRVSVGLRFRMLFETEESSVRRYMGTITGISDLDPARWPNSHWRSLKVGWDESTAGEKQPRVSLWEIEPLTTFPMYPSSFPLGPKRPWPTGLPFFHGGNDDISLNSPLMRLRDGGNPAIQSLNFRGVLQEMRTIDPTKQREQAQSQQSFLQATQDNQSGLFVKVYKSDSFGRTLDMTKFSSYHELRSELGCLFGLEGQLEDPLRSGWQLVFVDRENDVLLVGDDPWQEFRVHEVLEAIRVEVLLFKGLFEMDCLNLGWKSDGFRGQRQSDCCATETNIMPLTKVIRHIHGCLQKSARGKSYQNSQPCSEREMKANRSQSFMEMKK